jgi:hypothetical protein
VEDEVNGRPKESQAKVQQNYSQKSIVLAVFEVQGRGEVAGHAVGRTWCGPGARKEPREQSGNTAAILVEVRKRRAQEALFRRNHGYVDQKESGRQD